MFPSRMERRLGRAMNKRSKALDATINNGIAKGEQSTACAHLLELNSHLKSLLTRTETTGSIFTESSKVCLLLDRPRDTPKVFKLLPKERSTQNIF